VGDLGRRMFPCHTNVSTCAKEGCIQWFQPKNRPIQRGTSPIWEQRGGEEKLSEAPYPPPRETAASDESKTISAPRKTGGKTVLDELARKSHEKGFREN